MSGFRAEALVGRSYRSGGSGRREACLGGIRNGDVVRLRVGIRLVVRPHVSARVTAVVIDVRVPETCKADVVSDPVDAPLRPGLLPPCSLRKVLQVVSDERLYVLWIHGADESTSCSRRAIRADACSRRNWASSGFAISSCGISTRPTTYGAPRTAREIHLESMRQARERRVNRVEHPDETTAQIG